MAVGYQRSTQLRGSMEGPVCYQSECKRSLTEETAVKEELGVRKVVRGWGVGSPSTDSEDGKDCTYTGLAEACGTWGCWK